MCTASLNSELIDRIERTVAYYQEFHHKCVTWYITIIGFFIAGVIAAPEPTLTTRFLWLPILVSSVSTFVLFLYFLLHYGARIKLLTEYIDGKMEIPSNWRQSHKDVSIELHGSGSILFFAMLLTMQISVIAMLALRY